MAFSIIFTLVLLIALIGIRNVISLNLQYLIGNKRLSIVVYSLIFLPGVIIHEMSHFLTAAVLGVRTGDISFFPQEISANKIQRLGSVQVAKTGVIRSSLIGLAPLIFGSLIIIAITQWQFPEGVKQILSLPINFLWVYLIFAISNTMFISSSDSKSLPALFILFAILSLLAIYLGIAPKVAAVLYTPLVTSFNFLSTAFVISLTIDVVMLLPLIFLRYLSKVVK